MRVASYARRSALAADAWVQADEPAKALNAANEALARGAASFELLRTLADASLLNDDVEKALQYYDQALAMQPDARALFGRSLARAIAGDLDGSAQDLEKAQGDQAVPVDRYQRAMDVLAFEFDQISEKLKTIPMAVRMQGGPDMVPSAESMVKRTRALVDFLVRLRVPPRHKESHEGRDLAYKLLAQSSVEVLEFARSKNEDSAMEAAISLGEARKLVPKIGEAFRIERKYGQGTTTN